MNVSYTHSVVVSLPLTSSTSYNSRFISRRHYFLNAATCNTHIIIIKTTSSKCYNHIAISLYNIPIFIFQSLPRPGDELRILWLTFISSLSSSPLDHLATEPPSPHSTSHFEKQILFLKSYRGCRRQPEVVISQRTKGVNGDIDDVIDVVGGDASVVNHVLDSAILSATSQTSDSKFFE